MPYDIEAMKDHIGCYDGTSGWHERMRELRGSVERRYAFVGDVEKAGDIIVLWPKPTHP